MSTQIRSFLISMLVSVLFIMACQSESSNSTSANDSVSSQNCIQRILLEDDSLGRIRNNACKQISLGQTITKYTNELHKLDFSNCPKGFTIAFRKHGYAWQQMGLLVNQYPELRGEMHDLFDQIEAGKDSSAFKPLLKAIWDTWADVEKYKRE